MGMPPLSVMGRVGAVGKMMRALGIPGAKTPAAASNHPAAVSPTPCERTMSEVAGPDLGSSVRGGLERFPLIGVAVTECVASWGSPRPAEAMRLAELVAKALMQRAPRKP